MSHSKKFQLALVTVIAVACGETAVIAEQYPLYGEPYRPGFHFTPEQNWTNEPNGLVYHNGLYHMFYQANPFNNQFGNQSWGHATSPDLVNWAHQPVAIPAEGTNFTFSGSAITTNSSMTGPGTSQIVAAYTGFSSITGVQDQRIATSTDGFTFSKFANNPVLQDPVNPLEARDPKIFWHEPTQRWNMVLSHGGQERLSFWQSTDMKSWSFLSNFASPTLPASIGGWEVPDLFQLPVYNSAGQQVDDKWVLSMTPASGSPAGGNGVMYFVGEYNGTLFTNDNPTSQLWADYGRDFDGQQSWNNQPDGRVIWTGIMQSYGEATPTSPWRGQMALPRELSLVETPQGVRLRQQPIAELQTLRGNQITLANQVVSPSFDPIDATGLSGDMLEIVATFDPGTADSFGFWVREGSGQRTVVGYDVAASEMFVNRNLTGAPTSSMRGNHRAPLVTEDGLVKMHLFVDRGSIELFGGDGRAVISDLVFTNVANMGVSAFATGGNATLVSLEAYNLNSIWQQGPAPTPGSPAVVRWSMDPTPSAVGGAAGFSNPVTIDRRTQIGQGTQLGTTNPRYEPEPAIDNLYAFNNLPIPNRFITNAVVPPNAMFANGNNGGTVSYDASSLATADGALLLPVDRYGNELAFTDAFTVEMFFRTNGDQSAAGNMQLLLQGETSFRYGIIVNEGGAGNVRFAVNDKAGHIPIVDINSASSRNYADGEWHYLLAVYDPNANGDGELRLTITSEDGSAVTANGSLDALFQGLPAGGDGNLFIGRNAYSRAGDHRTFRGLIDEVQLSKGVIPSSLWLGLVSGANTALQGDYNGDNIVDAADYTVWRDNLGQNVSLPGENPAAATPGLVDDEDYVFWKAHFGETTEAGTGGIGSIPEPTTFSLMLFCVILTSIHRGARMKDQDASFDYGAYRF
jgi:fructan beta-fructosidase